MSSNDKKVEDLENNIRNIIKNSLYYWEEEINSEKNENENILKTEEIKDLINSNNIHNSIPIKSSNGKHFEKITSSYKKDLNKFNNNEIHNDDKENNNKHFNTINKSNEKADKEKAKEEEEDSKNELSRQMVFSPSAENQQKLNSDYSNWKDNKKASENHIPEKHKNFFNFQNEKYVQQLAQIKKKMQMNNSSEGTPFFPNFEQSKPEQSNNNKENNSETFNEKNIIRNNTKLDNEKELNHTNKNSYKKNLTTETNSNYNNNKTESNLGSSKNTADLKKLILEKNHSLQNKILEKTFTNKSNINVKNSGESYFNENLNLNQKRKKNFETISTPNSINFNTDKLQQYYNYKDAEIVDYIKEISKKLDKHLSTNNKKYYQTSRNKDFLNLTNRTNVNNF